MKIGIINHPNVNNLTPLSQLLQILVSITPNIYCILGKYEFNQYKNDKRFILHYISNPIYFNTVLKVLNYILLQMKIVKIIYKLRNDVEIYIFFIGGDTLLLPITFAKLLNKKVILLFAGSSIITHQLNQDKLNIGLKILHPPCFFLADKIILYTSNLIQVYQLEKYRNKILIAHRHIPDFKTFTVITTLPERPLLIGYIGRLSGEKDVQHFTQAIPAILSDREDLRVLIAGDGQLKETIEPGRPTGLDLPRESSTILEPVTPPCPSLLYRGAPEHYA